MQTNLTPSLSHCWLTADETAETTALFERLCAHFGVRPAFRWTKNDGSRAYRNRTGVGMELTVSLRTWRGWRQALLHEFAHIVCYHRGIRHGHDRAFYAVLIEVIEAAGVARTEYRWGTEYWTLWDLAVKQGLTTENWHRYERRALVQAAEPTPNDGGYRKALGVAKAVMFPTVVRVGQRVAWESQKDGVRLHGTVLSAYAGCRARVRLDDGREFYVPQPMLRPLEAS